MAPRDSLVRKTKRVVFVEALGLALVGLMACGGGVERIESASTKGSADFFTAKCKGGIADCADDARTQCGGDFTEVHRESHMGGVFADALPGPVTWYTLSFRCGASAADATDKARDDAAAAFVMPKCSPEWDGKCGLVTDDLAFDRKVDVAPLAIEDRNAMPADDDVGRQRMMQFALTRVCKEDEPISDGCRSKFRAAFMTAMRLRYPQAADARLWQWCTQHPDDCEPESLDRLRLLEQDLQRAHDRAVFAGLQKEIRKLQKQEEADLAQGHDQAVAANGEEQARQQRKVMLDQISQSMKETSQNTVYVHVNSDP